MEWSLEFDPVTHEHTLYSPNDGDRLPKWDELRWELIRQALKRSDNDVFRASKLIGYNPRTLHRELSDRNLLEKVPRKRGGFYREVLPEATSDVRPWECDPLPRHRDLRLVLITTAVLQHGGDILAAALETGISYKTLYRDYPRVEDRRKYLVRIRRPDGRFTRIPVDTD